MTVTDPTVRVPTFSDFGHKVRWSLVLVVRAEENTPFDFDNSRLGVRFAF